MTRWKKSLSRFSLQKPSLCRLLCLIDDDLKSDANRLGPRLQASEEDQFQRPRFSFAVSTEVLPGEGFTSRISTSYQLKIRCRSRAQQSTQHQPCMPCL